MDKKEKLYIDNLRHDIHMLGDLQTLRMILERMENYGERLCMVEKHKDKIIEHSVKDFREDVYALGTALLSMGYKGKHIAICSENSYYWVVTFFAVACGVGISVPVDKELTDEEISKAFDLLHILIARSVELSGNQKFMAISAKLVPSIEQRIQPLVITN